MSNERIIRLDYFRIILSLLVITLHSQPLFSEDSLTGWFISNGIARIAVPCFFIISGYFIAGRLDNRRELAQYLSRLLIVYIVWTAIYLPTYIGTVAPRSLITFSILGYYHLWFLPALILGVLMLKAAHSFIKNDNIILLSTLILYIAGYILESYGFQNRLFCNGIFFGYPFVAIGYYINKNRVAENIKPVYIYLLLIAGSVALFTQSYLDYGIEMYRNMSTALIILCPALFIYIIKGAKLGDSNEYIDKLASGIYYIHIMVITMIIPLSETDNIYKYPVIAGISILLAIFIIFLNKRIKIFL
ncbi:surface polysaccharide O-acyltransferase-like enzyme [Dysgonomonas sp. PFB1-18]|uniref:acyltransferase family protein n=1 Tax=unclassified Dysgonomonas TaxID=2630389 RepID=UPI0024735AD0|nr:MULTISPECIES: acyltransferase [unclassified Dysgonomonas]MDH6307587.1 surface polysaccharide O-acyltransferase-like enzyme [Dysgonomonas sp. PF1-14]MDH6337505.1 surface polysaccharide O-acyltransferase-like enzyme [Dysgonomonas sp. PF1-16]MDH6378730.1 surface polysaccharide O-acyltransferase-like enzyme [Dysgonomonas sp. PFB1-18]MDH6399148.1 surface polysaccharide O-acyltransferase-like enzyme [Dysgonomonas sp. PF1-23]